MTTIGLLRFLPRESLLIFTFTVAGRGIHSKSRAMHYPDTALDDALNIEITLVFRP